MGFDLVAAAILTSAVAFGKLIMSFDCGVRCKIDCGAMQNCLLWHKKMFCRVGET
jgi:hypothetical protein